MNRRIGSCLLAVGLVLAVCWAGCNQTSSANRNPESGSRQNRDKKPERPFNPNVLVTPEWLSEHRNDVGLRVLDLAKNASSYRLAHIPGATFVDWRVDIIDPVDPEHYTMPSKDQMEALLGRLGILPSTIIVLTDDMDTRASIRMYLTLRYYGHEQVRILDGGTQAYKAADLTLSNTVQEYPTTTYEIENVRDDYLVKIDAIRDIVDQSKTTHLIDGRPASQYSGRSKGRAFHTRKPHQRRGHISGAINIPWNANFDRDGLFKSVEDLRELYERHGVDTDDEAVAYCNEGLHAAVTWFVLREILGNEQVRVYDESLAEWANLEDTPMKEGRSR